MHRKVFVVGCYESNDFDLFPSHVSPIIAIKSGDLYYRATYLISNPYGIINITSTGLPQRNIHDLFPHPTYLLFEPKLISKKSQYVLLSKNKLLVSDNKASLLLSTFIFSLSKWHDLKCLKRSFITMRNIIL